MPKPAGSLGGQRNITITNWQPRIRNTLRGFFSAELPSGMILHNLAHLLYRVCLPNDEASTDLLKRVLEALAQRFNNDTATIDTNVFNASRIVKLPGTVAQKGDNTTERPHRLSRILEAPQKLEPVSLALLEELSASAAPPPRDPPRQSRTAFDVESWIQRHHLNVRLPASHEGGRK
jgi:hypothetical protein